MRPTKRFEQKLRYSPMDTYTLGFLGEYECEICGVGPLELDDQIEFICSVVPPMHEGWRGLWNDSYDVCPDCVEAGVASFPDRLRKHAQELEEKARELRKLADATNWQRYAADDPEARRADGDPL